jgi:hypothetical protein
MRVLFEGDQAVDLIPVVEVIAQGMKDLRLGQVQAVRHFLDVFAPEVKRGYMPNGYTQAIDDWFAPANAEAKSDEERGSGQK